MSPVSLVFHNLRLISKIELEQNFQSITLDVHASANKHPPHLSLLLNRNEHLNKKFKSCLDYFLWEFTDLENHVQDVVLVFDLNEVSNFIRNIYILTAEYLLPNIGMAVNYIHFNRA